jgi:hypothetical protein
MNLKQASIKILDQLSEVTAQVNEDDYFKPIESLSQSTIGQHLRHTLEFFICLENGFAAGLINYDKRSHDKLIETDKFLAMSMISKIKEFISVQKEDKPLTLEVGYDDSDKFISLPTNYARELVYNIEHAVHHMALIKIGIKEAINYVNLPADFGIAASTIRYKESVETSSH